MPRKKIGSCSPPGTSASTYIAKRATNAANVVRVRSRATHATKYSRSCSNSPTEVWGQIFIFDIWLSISTNVRRILLCCSDLSRSRLRSRLTAV